MKIILSGGYTLGPVTPLIAIQKVIKARYPEAEFLWVGTPNGPEQELVRVAGIRFTTLPSGKYRRYISFWNIVDIARLVHGFFQSLRLLAKESPDLCVSAGGFISVPLHIAAWIMGIPSWVHQQDVEVGLATKIMARAARVITVVVSENLKNFPKRKSIHLGNPVRRDVLDGDFSIARKLFGLSSNLPVVFATGGGTGSLRINQLIVEAVPQLKNVCQIIHLSGKDRPQELVANASKLFSEYYHAYQFFSQEMKHAYAIADIIISRGGFGTLSEIAALSKPAIIIPKPGHQVENVTHLQSKGAVVYVNEKTADGNYLARLIKDILADKVRQHQLGRTIHAALPPARDEEIVNILERLIKPKNAKRV